MLKITIYQNGPRTVFELEGRLAGPWVGELKECWQRAAGSAQLAVHLNQVSYVDHAGKLLLGEMHRQGVELAGEGCMNRAIIEEINQGEKK
jgi:hypothetical protein